MHLPIAISQGDIAGIGPEIIARAFRDADQVTAGCFVVGDLASMRRASQIVAGGALPLPVVAISDAGQALQCPPRSIALLEVHPQQRTREIVTPGELSAVAGQLAGDCVVWGAKAALRGEVAALVTAPLNKAALARAGGWLASFPGHTELLQALAAEHAGVPVSHMPVRMMLANDELRVVLVSIHVSLGDALRAVTFDNVLQTLMITHQAMRAVLGRAPNIGVAGLNPHAGEGGLFGREEIEVIGPAVLAARAKGVVASDPLAPDTVFMRARNTGSKVGEFDVVVAMYHDQGLIPVKYLGVERGVNVTLGLPIVRTSPDHGTAFEIAGQGTADASSFIEAIRMAKSLAPSWRSTFEAH